MSFGTRWRSWSWPGIGPQQVGRTDQAALVKKYGAAGGDAVDAQFERVEADSVDNCGSAGPSSAPAAAPAPTEPTASPAATSGVIMHRGLREPGRQRESGWLAQVQGRSRTCSRISAASRRTPAATRPTSPWTAPSWSRTRRPPWTRMTTRPPADNADWTAAMNDYVTAGEDYTGDNMNTRTTIPPRQPGDHGRQCGPGQLQRRQRRSAERDHPVVMTNRPGSVAGLERSAAGRRPAARPASGGCPARPGPDGRPGRATHAIAAGRERRPACHDIPDREHDAQVGGLDVRRVVQRGRPGSPGPGRSGPKVQRRFGVLEGADADVDRDEHRA